MDSRPLHSHNFVDHTGKFYNGIEALSFAGSSNNGTLWNFRCHCGNSFQNYVSIIKRGVVRSCGCLKNSKQPPNKKYWAGQRFGHLVALEPLRSAPRKRRSYWRFLCDCGKVVEKSLTNVVHNNTKSCGCMKSRLIREARSSPDDVVVFKNAYITHKASAARRGYATHLTLAQYTTIIKNPCFYCGGMSVRKKRFRSKDLSPEARVRMVAANSADRINNEPFYSLENTVACCFVCQKMKGVLKYTEFRAAVLKIAEHMLLRDKTLVVK